MPPAHESEPSLPQDFFAGDPASVPERLLSAAVFEFATKGFHAATTRAIGERAGISAAGVYVHYEVKTSLLFEITRRGHRSCLGVVDRALEEAGAEPKDRVGRFVKSFAQWHADHGMLARVSQYELAALPTRQFNQIVKLRRSFDDRLQTELRAGVEDGVFAIDNLDGTASAVLSLCIDLARWYTPRSRRRSELLAEFYAQLALKMIS